jgi:uncharacterized protein YbaR (Trm112 family)
MLFCEVDDGIPPLMPSRSRSTTTQEAPHVKRIAIRTFVANLIYYCTVPDSISALNCRGCRSPLDLHQPNPSQPEQFLATCPDCGRWSRVESTSGGGPVTIVELPEVGEINGPAPAADPHP